MNTCLRVLLFGFLSIASVQIIAQTESDVPALAEGIKVVAGYVRVPIPGQKNTAAFGSIKNMGKQAKQLVAVTTDSAERAEIHSHTMIDGLMRMRQVKQVVIPAGSQIEFASGGFHIMLFGVKAALQTGGHVALTLKFSDGSLMPVQLPVKSMYDHAHH